ncbi:MAG: DnaJ domain-containing protein [Alphaproteobacteria bacterium]
MQRRSPLNFDISVSADKKRRSRRRGHSGAIETSSRQCERDGCEKTGKFRAPKSPNNVEEFVWFCQEHIREYNRKWNFFENHTEEEFDEHVESDKVWGRETKPLGDSAKHARGTGMDREGQAYKRFGFDDPYEVLGANGTLNPEADANRIRQRRLPPTERKALEILDARDSMTKSEIRKVYKSLVKAMHPDLNGGRRDDEERLAEVVWAWEQVKGSRSFRD